ncbi:Piwi-domain-containing protein [Wolfiporia cocos MD-104 SS10]|uniref:Piwi-domain-containing protein n=1 Tax=Wolfiporia cocos (strain MD-104) TaxID=742152 RepID=A0A2H3JGQ7_WOLCO|nr:Piwi-domain-containing protein [Wolfiporia cocos MD-104 SS10]
MPPRARGGTGDASSRGSRGGPGRGGGRGAGAGPGRGAGAGPGRGAGAGPGRGAGRGRGAGVSGGPALRGGPAPAATGLPSANPHVTTTGVKRTSYGNAGRHITVFTNHFPVEVPDKVIHHYDGVIHPDEKKLPARLNMQIINRLQTVIAPQVFTPRAVYDGRKNMFASQELPFGNSGDFDVTLSDPPSPGQTATAEGTDRPPKVYKVRLTHVAQINPELLHRFLQGQQSHSNEILTAITALNVVVRMEPTLRYPFNVRSFFTDHETRPIGNGIVLWRGYFQSVRPAIGRMLINVDISTAAMYQPGPLLDLCLSFLGQNNPAVLAPQRGFPDRERMRLQRFLTGLRVIATPPRQQARRRNNPRVVKKVSPAGANSLSFTMREGGTTTVARYFQQTYNYTLRFPDIVCVEVGNGALIPLELCTVEPGQIMKKQVPPEKTNDVLQFATKKPPERLASIAAGLGVLQYGQSDYVRQFGLHVAPDARPMSVSARVLPPPTLKYGPGSQQPTIVPRDGAWNMVNRRFFQPCTITRWVVVVYERQNRFNDRTAQEMIRGLLEAARNTGITFVEQDPVVRWENGQGRIADQLRNAGQACNTKNRNAGFPDLMVVILPEGGADIYTAVKHFGDISAGVATQCMKSIKCSHAKAQYFANVCLKINVKRGGINTIPDPRSVVALTDPHNPTIVMGADVIHPPPGAEGRPSFTSLVANVDSDTAKYVATSRVQTSRQEIIEDLQEMAKYVIEMYMNYRKNREKKANPNPSRIIFYRDGVSEGQFSHVLERELPLIKAACAELGVNANVTLIVVGKRHHVRFFPQSQNDADRSGNCQAGTVVDRDVTHPLELDWYLQSHAGLLGTSRPAHYSVLHDENNFSADNLQALSFALCHVYARSTRSVSIPAPVYYADIVCARAKNHYDPQAGLDFSDSATVDEAAATNQLDAFRRGFKPLHRNMTFVMYFS